VYDDRTESCELYVLLNDITASLRRRTNESPEEEALQLLAIMSESLASGTRDTLISLQVGCLIALLSRSSL